MFDRSIVAQCDAHEGPVYVAGDAVLYATSVRRPGPQSVILRVVVDGGDVDEITVGAVMPNGMTLDHDGLLVVCEQGDLDHDACISRIDVVTGHREVVVDRWRDLPFNSPNDVVVAADGAIWFTDPEYGHLQGFRPRPELPALVHRWDPVTATTDVAADGFDKPNGIALSPDGSTLYVTDNGAPQHVLAFDVVDGRLDRRRVFAATPGDDPDGLKVDAAGHVYVSSAAGVLVLSSLGARLGDIVLPGAVNFTFGEPDRNVLFVTADTAIWAVELTATSPQPSITTGITP